MTPEQRNRLLESNKSLPSDGVNESLTSKKRKDWEVALEKELISETRKDRFPL